ncbi:MAG TPA: hypothetical protein VK447_17970 [Myxococcaceae bacterium]|nr:hypothetical protein [Myxococcaceae bacterium]
MPLLIALLVLGSAPASPKLKPLSFLAPPLLGTEARFPACDAKMQPDAAHAYCLPSAPSWEALCFVNSVLTRVAGSLRDVERNPTVEACRGSDPDLLFPSAQWTAPGPYRPADLSEVMTIEFGDIVTVGDDLTKSKAEQTRYHLTIDRRTGRLWVTVEARGRKEARKPFALGAAIRPVSALAESRSPYDLRSFGDLDGDGHPELLLAAKVSGITSRFQKAEGTGAALVSLSDPPRVLGFAFDRVERLYNVKHCQELGCDVVAFLDKAETCVHLAGEVGDDEETNRGLAEDMKGCERLKATKEKLLRKYRRDRFIHQTLSETDLGAFE